jgi:hypothetical protein
VLVFVVVRVHFVRVAVWNRVDEMGLLMAACCFMSLWSRYD